MAMKLAAAACFVSAADGAKLVRSNSSVVFDNKNPVPQIVGLLTDLKSHVVSDGHAEELSYDKYACWCEDTMARKASDIAKEQEQITELGSLIVKLGGEIATHGSEIQQLNKDIAENAESQREAKEVRDRQFEDFSAEKGESEQCAGALEAAVKVLGGAGTKKGFLETARDAELLSIVAGVRAVLARPKVSRAVSHSELEVVQRFVDNPEDFMAGRSGRVSAAQVSKNPFGDYAPQSTQIQGILKGMYDTFVGDLERANADEAGSQKAFEELMMTKQREAQTLEATLAQHNADEAAKTKKLAESRAILDDTKDQLDADQAFFAETKSGCQNKAQEWAERTRLRTEELAGIDQAIQILSGGDAARIFEDAHNTLLLQLTSQAAGAEGKERSAAFAKLKKMAATYKNLGLAQIALTLKNGGHFDKVTQAIDVMIEQLRKEEQADIEHRDRCQGAQNKNKNSMEDAGQAMKKADAQIARLQTQMDRLSGEITLLETDVATTQATMEDRLKMRNGEEADFQKALKDDGDAVELLHKATAAMKEFYRRNKIELALAAKGIKQSQPKYTENPDKAPETNWSGAKYGGTSEETGGVVAILEMVAEDLQNEMNVAREEDAKGQQTYLSERAAMQDMLDKQLAVKLAKERELSDMGAKKLDTKAEKDAATADQGAEAEMSQVLVQDCAWVATHFDSRRTSRKAEMDGLVEAKGYLAGVDSGEVI